MSGFWCGNNAFSASKLEGTVETLCLRDRNRFDQTQLVDVRDQGRHPVVAETACMNGLWNKPMTQRMHFHEWREPCGIAKVITIFALRESGASGRLDTANRGVHVAGEFFAQKGKGEAAKIRTPAGTTHEHIGRFAYFCQLQERFLPNNGLVQ